jgi:hypothetical protein
MISGAGQPPSATHCCPSGGTSVQVKPVGQVVPWLDDGEQSWPQ